MDRTAIDDTDDFGIQPDSVPTIRRSRFRWLLFFLSAIITAFCCAADTAFMHTEREGSLFVVDDIGIPADMYLSRVLTVVVISQISCAVTGILAIIAANTWAHARFFPGTRKRIVFAASKWVVIVLLMIADAYFLEVLYENVFIFQTPH